MRAFQGADFGGAAPVEGGGVSGGQFLSVHLNPALGDMQPGVAGRSQFVSDFLSRLQLRQPKIGILMDGDGAVPARLAGDEMPLAGLRRGQRFFRVARRDAQLSG